MAYNPFDKPIHDLKASDLGILVRDSVAEGYWVEYKSEFQSGEKIAKSIASFANTYGGWYFVGVEANKIDNTATKITGFSLVDVSDPISKLRESIKSNVDPIPIFYPRLVELEVGKVVLVVEVPNNQETPFITRSGRIYRRVCDSSDPVAETNRYAVDRLVDNGRELARRFERFCKDERTFSESEKYLSWVNIFVAPYPLGTEFRYELLSAKGIDDLLKSSQTPLKLYIGDKEIGSGNLPFTSGQMGVGSVILRQVEPSRVAFNSLMVELCINGWAKFHIPVTYIPVFQNRNISFHSSRAQQVLDELLQSDNCGDLEHLRFFDVKQLWEMVTTISTFYQNWWGGAQEINLRMVIIMANIWRLVPFSDTDEWGNHVRKFGLPVQNMDFVRVPTENQKSLTSRCCAA